MTTYNVSWIESGSIKSETRDNHRDAQDYARRLSESKTGVTVTVRADGIVISHYRNGYYIPSEDEES